MLRIITILLISSSLIGCPNTTPSKTGQPPYKKPFYSGIMKISIEGISVGMSPRRVFDEYQKNNWNLNAFSTVTFEDMIESGIKEASFYISTEQGNKSNLDIFFRDNKVFYIRKTYNIREEEYEKEILNARSQLSSLGKIQEKHKDMSFILEYRPYKTSFAYYDFHKLVKNQRGYRVWFTVYNY